MPTKKRWRWTGWKTRRKSGRSLSGAETVALRRRTERSPDSPCRRRWRPPRARCRRRNEPCAPRSGEWADALEMTPPLGEAQAGDRTGLDALRPPSGPAPGNPPIGRFFRASESWPAWQSSAGSVREASPARVALGRWGAPRDSAARPTRRGGPKGHLGRIVRSSELASDVDCTVPESDHDDAAPAEFGGPIGISVRVRVQHRSVEVTFWHRARVRRRMVVARTDQDGLELFLSGQARVQMA